MRIGDVSRKRRLRGDLRAGYYADFRTARMNRKVVPCSREAVVANAIGLFRRLYPKRKAQFEQRQRQCEISNAKQVLLSRVWNQFHESLPKSGKGQYLLMGDGSVFQSRGLAESGQPSFRLLAARSPWAIDGLLLSEVRIGGSRSRCGVVVTKEVAVKLRAMGDFVLGAKHDCN